MGSKLVGLRTKDDLKDKITADIFEKVSGDTFQCGLSDPSNLSDLEEQMKLLKQKWSGAHEKGAEFYEWFIKNKAKGICRECFSSRSRKGRIRMSPRKIYHKQIRTDNCVIQDFVKRKTGGIKLTNMFLHKH